MKKILILIIVTTIITLIIPVSGLTMMSNENKSELNNFENIEWYGCNIRPTQEIPFLKKATSKPLLIDLPEYFNWRDYKGKDWTTSAKDQQWPTCGSCWAFAALGALESVINIRTDNPDLDMDLSEQYILSCLPLAGSCRGGNVFLALHYLMSNTSNGNYYNGAIPEFCFPYQADDDVPCSEKCDNWVNYLIPISDYGYWQPDGSIEDREAIKTQIMETGPVIAHMLITREFYLWGFANHEPDDYYPYPGKVYDTNHVFVIVGWNDDISITNGGYWICKNSFGTGFGYDGFFNIEFGSLNIENYNVGWVSVNLSSDLYCEGNIVFNDVKPGETIISGFSIENKGVSFSNLSWEIVEWPEWGNWTFSINEGYNLTPEDGSLYIEVSVKIPNEKNHNFIGEIKIINKEFYSDYEIIPVSISTSKHKEVDFPIIWNLVENTKDYFFILRKSISHD